MKQIAILPLATFALLFSAAHDATALAASEQELRDALAECKKLAEPTAKDECVSNAKNRHGRGEGDEKSKDGKDKQAQKAKDSKDSKKAKAEKSPKDTAKEEKAKGEKDLSDEIEEVADKKAAKNKKQ